MAELPTKTVTARWEGGYRFTHHDACGHAIVTDAPTSPHAPFEGFQPADLLISALARCTGIDVADILRKQRQDLRGLEINVRGVQEPEPPWPFREVHMEFVARGCDLDPAKLERAIHLSEIKYCSVGATIAGVARITTSFRIVAEP